MGRNEEGIQCCAGRVSVDAARLSGDSPHVRSLCSRFWHVWEAGLYGEGGVGCLVGGRGGKDYLGITAESDFQPGFR